MFQTRFNIAWHFSDKFLFSISIWDIKLEISVQKLKTANKIDLFRAHTNKFGVELESFRFLLIV